MTIIVQATFYFVEKKSIRIQAPLKVASTSPAYNRLVPVQVMFAPKQVDPTKSIIQTEERQRILAMRKTLGR